jgi:hypothetical protein
MNGRCLRQYSELSPGHISEIPLEHGCDFRRFAAMKFTAMKTRAGRAADQIGVRCSIH